MLNVAVILEDGAQEDQDHEAAISGDTRQAYVWSNSLHFPIVYDEIAKTGMTVVALSIRLATLDTAAAGTAVVLYVSGTTDSLKGAELTYRKLMHNALKMYRMIDARARNVHLVAMPLFPSFGITGRLNAGFTARATLVLLARFDPVVGSGCHVNPTRPGAPSRLGEGACVRRRDLDRLPVPDRDWVRRVGRGMHPRPTT